MHPGKVGYTRVKGCERVSQLGLRSGSRRKGDTVERDAFNEDTQPWRARRPDEDGWLADEEG